jgi:hypothetical protein
VHGTSYIVYIIRGAVSLLDHLTHIHIRVEYIGIDLGVRASSFSFPAITGGSMSMTLRMLILQVSTGSYVQLNTRYDNDFLDDLERGERTLPGLSPSVNGPVS